MPPTYDLGHDYHDDMVASAQASCAEAQLLPGQTFFEDNDVTFEPYPSLQKNFWDRLQGPQPPRPQTITPLFPSAQRAPARFLDHRLPNKRHQIYALVITIGLWLVVFLLILRSQLPIRDGHDGNVVNLDCVDTLWRRKNECGLDGIDCRPFRDDEFAFHCPADCAGVQVLNPHAVGSMDVNYRPLVIGDQTYRGDSFICGSAIHAGIVSDSAGGCGRLSRLGDYSNFVASKKNGIDSIPFDSYFPLSFSVSEDSSFSCSSDPRQALFIVSLLSTAIVSIFWTSPLQFFPLFIMIFVHVAFASDPPSASYRNTSVLPDHISAFAKRLLPALFCAVVLYWAVVKRTLSGLKVPLDRTILWLGGFWFGALSNHTFEWIPISRLTAHDLEQQPGAKAALAVILVVLVCIIAQQVYYFWVEGRLPHYLALYGLFIFSILICLVIPGVSLRLHHYVLALLLLPGTSMQTRPSLLYQGILLGLFVNGVARWDFDSILQTAADLQGDATLNSAIPSLLKPVIFQSNDRFTATFFWAMPPAGIHGISALVNDVERYRVFFDHGAEQNFTWNRDIGLELPEYIRFAFVKDGRSLDYTKAGTLFSDGTWQMGEAG